MEAGPVGRMVRAAMFAAVSVTLAATGHVLMSEDPIPFWVLATGFLALAVPGWWFAARERGPWLVTGLAVATQGVLHNAFATAQSALTTVGGTVGDAAARTVAGAGAVPPDVRAGAHPMAVMDHYHMAGMDHSAASGMNSASDVSGASGASGAMTGTEHMTGTGHMAGMEHMAGTEHVFAVDPMGSMAHIGRMSPIDHMGSMGHMGHDMAGMSSTGMLAAHVLAALLCGVWLARGERAAFQVLRAVASRLLAPLHPLLTAPLPAPRRRLRPRRGLSDRLPLGLRCARARDRRGPPGVLAAS
ncbi:hypothetical protein [Streptomyces sp. NPDC014685]|uniref:hypothetical protein n=1 Tax=Streptomyces sp. NPDC014685 TaxID=3364881 RepID=UPI0036FF02C1